MEGTVALAPPPAAGIYNHMVVDRLTENELTRVFRALADATRRDILRRTLVGAVSVSGLAADYEMSFAAVQKHVAVLEEAGLVAKASAGRERLVRAGPPQNAPAPGRLHELELLWRPPLTRPGALPSRPPGETMPLTAGR